MNAGHERSGVFLSVSCNVISTGTCTVETSGRVIERGAFFFAVLGNTLRWEMVKLLAKQGPMCATQVAELMKRDSDGASKHLRVLRKGGVVQSVAGKDRRLVLFATPAANQPEPGLLDYGLVKVDRRAPAEEPALKVLT